MTAAVQYLGKATLLVQKVQNAVLLLDQVKHILVVNKLDVAPVNLLLLILSLRTSGANGKSLAGSRRKQ